MKWINEFLDFQVKKAQGLRLDAGYGGRMGDDGAQALDEKIQAYRAGYEGFIPSYWVAEFNAFVKQAEAEIDPEYKEFMRLKKKFT